MIALLAVAAACTAACAGTAGKDGSNGQAGPQGAGGAVGATGAAGDPGPEGPEGPAGSTTSGDGGASSTTATWLDGDGTPVNVLSVDIPNAQLFFFDAAGVIWKYRLDTETVEVTSSDPDLYYTTSDCSGSAYKQATPPMMSVQEQGIVIYRDGAAPAGTSSPGSKRLANDAISCSPSQFSSRRLVARASYKTAGATPILVAPLHPLP